MFTGAFLYVFHILSMIGVDNMWQGILWAFLGTCFTFSVTSLGSLNVYILKNKLNSNTQSVFLGFAGGVMIAASIWSLLLPAIDRAEENGQISWLVATSGFLLGVILLLLLDAWIKKKARNRKFGALDLQSTTGMLLLAITIHNIPEGMAVGLAFAMAAERLEDTNLLTGAIALAIGIGIQNYPEGAAVALPLFKEGMSRKKAFFIGSMSAIVEPVFGVLAAVMASFISQFMPFLLSFAAGTMIYVVIEELVPEAHAGGKEKTGTIGFILGFVIMMILDIALG